MKRSEIDLFEKLKAQLDGIYQELSLLAKRSPNDGVNPFKLKFINDILVQCNHLLGEKYRPFPEFEIFSLDDVPSNSDATFIVAQYIECAEELRCDNINQVYNKWFWNVDGGTEIRTAPPSKLKN